MIYAVHGGNVNIHYEENDGLKYDIPLHNEGFSALSCRLKTMVVTFRGLDGQRRQY
ncbi:hypothetical protein XBKQ1_2220012 [Xenorhabdus bovienii str. kraussei Quebec]|uniref:Uncharacterized protein n=1 Tax=Xenorhabdus bovienii str. kraussei Quebec TaxID=1398203 RepID=A0A077PEJ9_XENBV|nr:hypothetical protein XBKQ1_2220012 [Xenorhabdus bovienii str. kraussei Quebec]